MHEREGKKWTKKSVNLASAEVVEGFRPVLQTSDKCLKSLNPVKMRRMRRLQLSLSSHGLGNMICSAAAITADVLSATPRIPEKINGREGGLIPVKNAAAAAGRRLPD